MIDQLNDVAAARQFVESMGSRACVSSVTRAEVMAGYDADRRPRVALLLDQLAFLPAGREISDLTGALRREYGWRLPDAMQAATAIVHGLQLATRNTRDFPPERHDFVIVPYTL